MSYPCCPCGQSTGVFHPIPWPTVPIVCILSLETTQLFLPKDPSGVLHILSLGDTLVHPLRPRNFSHCAHCLENTTHPLSLSFTRSSSQCLGAPEGGSPRAWETHSLVSAPIWQGAARAPWRPAESRMGRIAFPRAGLLLTVHTSGFHTRLFLKDSFFNIKRRNVWMWLFFTQLPWLHITNCLSLFSLLKVLFGVCIAKCPKGCLVYFLSSLHLYRLLQRERGWHLSPCIIFWVHLSLTTQSFIHSVIQRFHRCLLSTYYVQNIAFNEEETKCNGKWFSSRSLQFRGV